MVETDRTGDLAARLRDLRLRCGAPSFAELVKLSEVVGERIPRATIHEKFHGKSLPRYTQLTAMVKACLRHADEHAIPVDDHLRDLETWRDRWSAAKQGASRTPSVGAKSAALLAERRAKDRALFAAVEIDETPESIFAALNRALALGMISPSGCEIELPGTEFMLHFTPSRKDDPRAIFVVTLLDQDRRRLSNLNWNRDGSTADFLVDVAERLQVFGEYPGDEAFDPAMILRRLRDLLELGYHCAIGGSIHGNRVLDIVRLFPPQWALTDDGLLNLEGGGGYTISAAQLHEPGWLEHMRKKPWVDPTRFAKALRAAQLLENERRRAPDIGEPSS